jgi:hypothetical protein
MEWRLRPAALTPWQMPWLSWPGREDWLGGSRQARAERLRSLPGSERWSDWIEVTAKCAGLRQRRRQHDSVPVSAEAAATRDYAAHSGPDFTGSAADGTGRQKSSLAFCPDIASTHGDSALHPLAAHPLGRSLSRGGTLPSAVTAVGHSRFCRDRSAGNQQVMVVPTPSSLSADTRPPWASTRCFTMARPSPVPPWSRERAGSER